MTWHVGSPQELAIIVPKIANKVHDFLQTACSEAAIAYGDGFDTGDKFSREAAKWLEEGADKWTVISCVADSMFGDEDIICDYAGDRIYDELVQHRFSADDITIWNAICDELSWKMGMALQSLRKDAQL